MRLSKPLSRFRSAFWTGFCLMLSTAAGADPAVEALSKAREAARSLTQPVTLKVWNTHNREESETLREQINRFTSQYPSIRVELDTVAFADAQNKFKTAAKAGTAPDVFRSEVVWTPELADLGYLTPVDEWLSEADRADFLEAPLATCQYREETWGLPQVTDCLALLVNRAALKKAGVAVPTTMDELSSAARVLGKPADQRYGFAYPANESYFILPYLWAFGGDLVEASKREVLVDGPGAVRGLEFVLDLRRSGAVSPKFDVANDYNNQLEDFRGGLLPMFLMGPWATAAILSGDGFKSDPTNLGIHPVPAGPGAHRNSPIGGHTWTIGARCARPELAFLLIHHLTTPAEQAELTRKNNLLPTRKSAYDLEAVKTNSIALAFREVLNSARPRPVLPETASLIPALTPAFQDALRGDKTPAQALQSVAAQWRQQLRK